MKVALISTGVIAVVLGVIYAIFWVPGTIGCASRWSGSSFDTRYGVLSGCQVKATGRWVPERVYREN